jgi:fermentation-respiration switch protein FrsA (DUF1100 family)
MNILLKIIAWAAGIYMVHCTLMFLLQRQIIFPRNQIGPLPETKRQIPGMEEIWLDTAAGKVEAWFLLPATALHTGPAPAMIFAHGNAEVIDFCVDDLLFFTRLGIGVMLVEYPGYGRSQGRPSQESITEIFIAAYDMLTAWKEVDADRVILYGHSLGGGAVCALAARRPAAALILMSTFTGIHPFTRRFLVPGFLVRDPFDNLSVISAYSGPVLIIHGTYDDIIPYSHGLALYKAARNATMVTYACAHNDCPPNGDVYVKDIKSFLQKSGIIPIENH